MEFKAAKEVTVAIDNTGNTPWVRWKENGDPLFDWKMMRITEWGNLWLPEEFVKDYCAQTPERNVVRLSAIQKLGKGENKMGWLILATVLLLGLAAGVVHHVDHTDDGMYGACHDIF